MENSARIKAKCIGKKQLLSNPNFQTETSNAEHHPSKRIKLGEQNLFCIDTTRVTPDDTSYDSKNEPTVNKDLPNNAFLGEINPNSPRPNLTGLPFQNRQEFPGSPTKGAFGTDFDMDSSMDKNSFRDKKQHSKEPELLTNETASKNVEVVSVPKIYKYCTLYPPQKSPELNHKLLKPPERCKTVIVSGVPHNLQSHVIREIFSDYGEIRQIIHIEKSVFQITYTGLAVVGKVIELNGYKIVGNEKNIPFAGTIELDFVPVWLEKFKAGLRPISTWKNLSAKTNYSIFEAANLVQDLEKDSMVTQSVNVVVRWLEDGKCTKNNCKNFVFVLKAMNDLVFRFIRDPSKFDEFVLQNYCSQILNAFNVACSHNVTKTLRQFGENQVEKWKNDIEEINKCKTWEAVSKFLKTKSYLESSDHLEYVESPLPDSVTIMIITELIYKLEKDSIDEQLLNKIILRMELGKCTNYNCFLYFYALKALNGFISRFTKNETKFKELVCQDYCGKMLKVFHVACSEIIFSHFKKSQKQKIKKWKKNIQEVNEEAVSKFVKRNSEEIKGKSEGLLSDKNQPNIELEAIDMKNDNQNNDIQNNEISNHNTENCIQSKKIIKHSDTNDNKNNETGNNNNENDTLVNKTDSFNDEDDVPIKQTGSNSKENDIQKNGNVKTTEEYIHMCLEKFIKELKNDCLIEDQLNMILCWMKNDKCTKCNSRQFVRALRAMHCFVKRLTRGPKLFKKLVCHDYCGKILKVFNVACSKVAKHKQPKVRRWKENIEKVNESCSWKEAVSALKKKTKQINKHDINETEKHSYEIDIHNNKTGNQNSESDIQNNKTHSNNKENNSQNNVTKKHNKEKDIKNNETVNHNNKTDIQNNKTHSNSKENNSQNYVTKKSNKEDDIKNNETVNHINKTDIQNNITENQNSESDIQNKENHNLNKKNCIPSKVSGNHSYVKGIQIIKTGNQNTENDLHNNEYTNNQNNKNEVENNNNEVEDNKNEVKNIKYEVEDNKDIGVKINGKEARLIASLGAFLNIHRFGANIRSIFKYLLQIDPTIKSQEIEELMRKFPTVFEEELTSDNSSETKWTILDF